MQKDCKYFENIKIKDSTSTSLESCSHESVKCATDASGLSESDNDDKQFSIKESYLINTMDDKEITSDEKFRRETGLPLISGILNELATDTSSTYESDVDDQSLFIKSNTINSTDKEFFHSDDSDENTDESFSDLSEFENQQNLSDDSNINTVDTESSEEKTTERRSFMNLLRDWEIMYKITLVALTALLLILRNYTEHSYLPFDARTLIKTEKKTKTSQILGGEYLHFGVEKAVRSILRDYQRKGIEKRHIKLGVNVDGLPIYKSSNEGLWLILCSEIDSKEVYSVGAYFGRGKPGNANEFVKQFVDEATKLINNGLKEENVSISITFLSCDTPAKAFILYLKGHTGYDSCSKCYIGGVYVKINPKKKNTKNRGQICFPGTGPFQLRTDNDNFESHVRPLIADLPEFGFISSAPLDYMHLILLGVVKR